MMTIDTSTEAVERLLEGVTLALELGFAKKGEMK